MNSKKMFLVESVTFVLIFLAANLGFSQARKEETIVYGGIIKSISKDYKSILVYNENIQISSNTKIFDEKGKPLRIEDLKPELYVVVEGVVNSKGFLAKKITLKKRPEV
jgi:hypothetical protein